LGSFVHPSSLRYDATGPSLFAESKLRSDRFLGSFRFFMGGSFFHAILAPFCPIPSVTLRA
jgi:hypothetical protein